MISAHPFAFLLLSLAACQATGSSPQKQSAPQARILPERLEAHGHVRVDDYYWMRERADPAVVAYLEAENTYAAAVMAPTESLQAELYEEMVGRVRQDDSTVPSRQGDWWYYTRYEDGSAYPIHCRKLRSLEADEEVLLDLNHLAEGHGYFAISGRTPSPDHDRLAYAVDTRGRRIYTLEVLDLASREVSDRIEGIAANLVWAEDGRHLFYARRDPETLRTYQIWRHELGSDCTSDVLVFEETDETFSCSVSKTRSKHFITISSRQTLTTEVRLIEADAPFEEFRVLLPRERGHEYSVDHHGQYLYLRTNRDAPNFRLVRALIESPMVWEEVVPHRSDVFLEGALLFQDHMVLRERNEGLRQLTVRSMGDGEEHQVKFDEPTYRLGTRSNPEFITNALRFSYSSLTTPSTVYDYDMVTRDRTLRKRDEVGGGFDSDDYRSERLWARATDGTRVPISLVYRLPFERDGRRPLLLYAYGSYGSSMDAGFSANGVSLLDRGFVYAIAHVRGGQELGRAWYEGGKLLNKRNTFTDFIDCGEHLVAEGYTSPERLCAMGGSAGGLLMGAVVNMRPDLFSAVVAAVPFVDVVTTMLDASIPLTSFEWDEWGDPREKNYYDYMLSYSPYDRVTEQEYPAMLVTTGFHDSQVQYWEPAKWVAKLRAKSTSHQPLVFKTEMEAGHGGRSGRYERYKNQALTYAFLLSNVK